MENKPFRYLILDTNIIQHLGNDELASQILSQLRNAEALGYLICFSDFSILELVDCANVKVEERRLKTLQKFKFFPLEQQLLILAGHLGGLYLEDGLNERQQPEKGDKIIGATSLYYNAVIYTTNGRDFPPPYFQIYSKHLLKYHKDNTEVNILGYFIVPDPITLQGRYNYRLKKAARGEIIIAPTITNTEKDL